MAERVRRVESSRFENDAPTPLPPAFVLDAFRVAKGILEKFERLPNEQRTDEGRVAATRMACAIFDARLKRRLH